MFCSECGAKAGGKFCAACGARLVPPGAPVETLELVEVVEDWSQLIDYKRLIVIPEVRDMIAASAARSKKGMSGEQWLELYDKALSKFTGVSLPMVGIAKFAQSLHAKMGIHTGKSRSQFLTRPPGEVLVSLLCAHAAQGREVRGAHQQADGVVIVSALPSDLFALEGDLIVHVARAAGGARVEASTEIKGQLFDWGKSTRCLEALFAELASSAAAA